MLQTECEKITTKLSPYVRREIVICLCKKGMSGKQIADMLELTPAAVSQYKNAKRGSKLTVNKKCEKIICGAAEEILKNPDKKEKIFSQCVCSVCKEVKK